jgi:hypothetical protein
VSRFLNEPVCSLVEGGWRLECDLVYESNFLQREVTAQTGFVTDLASVPWFARWIVPVSTGKNRKAAIIHDWLCVYGKEEGVTQAQADRVFSEALEACGVGVVGRWGLFIPVRAYQSVTGLFE